MADRSEEMGQLDAFHRELASAGPSGQPSLLRNGFLPEDPAVLVEAGIRCIPLIEADDLHLVDAAQDRFTGILFKLRMGPETLETRKASERFDAVLEGKRRQAASDTRWGLVVLGGLLLVILAPLAFLARWLSR